MPGVGDSQEITLFTLVDKPQESNFDQLCGELTRQTKKENKLAE